LICFKDIDSYIDSISATTLKYKNIVKLSDNITIREANVDTRSDPDIIQILDIKRFRCACHILNNVVKASALQQKYLAEKIKKLSTFASTIRNSIKHSNLFGEAKCRPKTENSTRWFSHYIVLKWAQKAYSKELFSSLEVPMTIDEIEMYLQIFEPAYNISLIFQRTESTICDVLPNILNLKWTWSRMDVGDQEGLEMLYFLVQLLSEKFSLEFKSPVYKVISDF
jgi:hypothetical protein